MTHRLVPLAPDRTWVECSWLVPPGADGPVPTRRTRWTSGTSPTGRTGRPASRCSAGCASPHFRPGPLAPNEDAVYHLVTLLARAYRDPQGRLG